jgi:hypothetical protein
LNKLLWPKTPLRKDSGEGDMAMIVEFHPVSEGEDGYSLEVFNAMGETITIVTVPESTTHA